MTVAYRTLNTEEAETCPKLILTAAATTTISGEQAFEDNAETDGIQGSIDDTFSSIEAITGCEVNTMAGVFAGIAIMLGGAYAIVSSFRKDATQLVNKQSNDSSESENGFSFKQALKWAGVIGASIATAVTCVRGPPTIVTKWWNQAACPANVAKLVKSIKSAEFKGKYVIDSKKNLFDQLKFDTPEEIVKSIAEMLTFNNGAKKTKRTMLEEKAAKGTDTEKDQAKKDLDELVAADKKKAEKRATDKKAIDDMTADKETKDKKMAEFDTKIAEEDAKDIFADYVINKDAEAKAKADAEAEAAKQKANGTAGTGETTPPATTAEGETTPPATTAEGETTPPATTAEGEKEKANGTAGTAQKK